MNSVERLQQLILIQSDFEVAKTNQVTGDPSSWVSIQKIKKPFQDYNHREQLKNELIIEIDAKTMEESKKLYEQIKPKMQKTGLSWGCWTTHSKSYHLHLFFDREISKEERKAFIFQTFSPEEIKFFDKNFWDAKRHMIAIGGAIHYKSKKPKELIEKIGMGQCVFPKIKIEKTTEKNNTTKNKPFNEILAETNPSETYRSSLVMKLREFNGWNAQQITDYIEKNNKWADFNKKITKTKVEGILLDYAEKQNPNKPTITDVPTLQFADFSKYDSIFENTHSHLPAYDLIDEELGLNGDEYYTLKKFINYFVESMRQKTISFTVGNQFFDNRIHGAIFAGAGLGKGRIKHIIKLHNEATECNAERTHIEQLIGKIVKEKGIEIERKGYFDRKALIGDEAQATVNEEDKNVAGIMREFRGAMDAFTLNQVEKQLTGTDTLKYYPETRFLFLLHDVILQPIFFDSGTYRRMFCFEIKPVQVKEDSAIANLYKESQTNKMKEYIRTDALYLDDLSFSKEAIDEIADWIITLNRFTNQNPNQRIRSVCKRMFFSAAIYFFRVTAILSIIKGQRSVTSSIARQGCFDCMQFLLKTFELFANKGNVTLSRDVWKTEDLHTAMFLEWLHHNGAISMEHTPISIAVAQNQIGDIWGTNERQSRSIFQKLKKTGLINTWKGRHDSKAWLAFKPGVEGFVDYEDIEKIDLFAYLLDKKEKIEANESANKLVSKF